jgi:hypothetical protein
MSVTARLKRSPYDWNSDSWARANNFAYVVQDSDVIAILAPRASSSSATITLLPTHGSMLNKGTAPRAGVLSTSDEQKNVASYLATVKRVTGLSWERIGTLLGCTRQTVYNWTQGDPVKPENARQVAALHETLTYIDRGSQAETVSALEARVGGRTILELIRDGDFVGARKHAGKGIGSATATWTKMQPQKPSGREDHWTDRVAAQSDSAVDAGHDFAPSKVVKKAKFKLK